MADDERCADHVLRIAELEHEVVRLTEATADLTRRLSLAENSRRHNTIANDFLDMPRHSPMPAPALNGGDGAPR